MIPRLPLSLILAVACIATAHAQESFTKSLSPADFQAAGLGKLTPGELAALDALIEGRQTGAVIKAKEETTQVVTAKVREETTKVVTETVRKQVQAEDVKEAQKKQSSMGFVEKLKVVLKPGTEIEYTTLDAMLVPPFTGWEKGTVFTLTNGQRWIVTDEGNYWSPKKNKPVPARIEPGALGSFFMEIEKGGRPRVKFLDNTSAPPQATP
jgi:hypothetical protein